MLLVRQAEQLVGKSFLELIRILVPAQAEQAKVQIGQHQAFTLPLVQAETDGAHGDIKRVRRDIQRKQFSVKRQRHGAGD